MNFYQSDLWYTITSQIYKKPTFPVTFCDQSYRGITKQQQKFWTSFQWYMLHGLRRDTQHTLTELDWPSVAIQTSLQTIRRDYGKTWGDIFFQFWFIDIVDECHTMHMKDKEVVASFVQHKKQLQNNLWTNYKLFPSHRWHMPDTTIVLDLTKPLDDIRSWYSDSGKRYINKWKKAQLTFVVADEKLQESFYRIWYTMAYDKWFFVPSQDMYTQLMRWLTQNNQGALLVAMQGETIVSGSICVWIGSDLYYLYGATDRSFGDIGWHYWLTDRIIEWGQQQWYKNFDLLWVAPPDAWSTHPLSGVTRFKQAFGGKTIMYLGNYDYVFSPWLYQAFLLSRKM